MGRSKHVTYRLRVLGIAAGGSPMCHEYGECEDGEGDDVPTPTRGVRRSENDYVAPTEVGVLEGELKGIRPDGERRLVGGDGVRWGR